VTTPPSAAPPRRFDGPLVIDPARMVLRHRVDDVPPPPDFVLRPFAPACEPETREPARPPLSAGPAVVIRACVAVTGAAVDPPAPAPVVAGAQPLGGGARTPGETETGRADCPPVGAVASSRQAVAGVEPSEAVSIARAIAELDAAFADAGAGAADSAFGVEAARS
jgi:hypothetical protein